MRSCAATSGSRYAFLTASIGGDPPVKAVSQVISQACRAAPYPRGHCCLLLRELLSLHAFDPKRELFRTIEISQNVPMHGAMMYLTVGGVRVAQPHSRTADSHLSFIYLFPPITGLRRDV